MWKNIRDQCRSYKLGDEYGQKSIEVNYDHSKGDCWNVPVPLDIDGEYVIEVIAEDEAGNQSFITRLLYTVKGENICVHQLPLSGYLFEKVERKICFNRMYPKCKEVQR